MSKEIVCNWIPVSEGLPDKDGEYLITVTRWSNVIDSWIEDDVTMCSFYGGEFDICRRCWEDGHQPIIKAWAKLPKPYKEDETSAKNQAIKDKDDHKGWYAC